MKLLTATIAILLLCVAAGCSAMDFTKYTYHLTVEHNGYREHGTAVAVYAENFGHFIITANHCVFDTEEAVLTNASGTLVGKVVYRDAGMDFAILKADAKDWAILDKDDTLSIGTALIFCHYPRGVGPRTSNATLTEMQNGIINFYANADSFFSGSSGCPVFLKGSNNVVGIGVAGQGIGGKMIEGSAIFLPARRIFQSMKQYVDEKANAKALAVIVDLGEKF